MAGELITFLIGMVGVSVGGIITFIVNRKLQNQIWSHERARDIYAPILTQLGQAEDSDLNQLKHKFWYSKWDKLRKNPLFYWIKPDIKKKAFFFPSEFT